MGTDHPRLRMLKYPSTVLVCQKCANVFLCGVIDGAMPGEFVADHRIDRAFVGH